MLNNIFTEKVVKFIQHKFVQFILASIAILISASGLGSSLNPYLGDYSGAIQWGACLFFCMCWEFKILFIKN